MIVDLLDLFHTQIQAVVSKEDNAQRKEAYTSVHKYGVNFCFFICDPTVLSLLFFFTGRPSICGEVLTFHAHALASAARTRPPPPLALRRSRRRKYHEYLDVFERERC